MIARGRYGVGRPRSVAALILCAVFALSVTDNTAKKPPKRTDAKEVTTLTTELEGTDVQSIAVKMVDSLLQSPVLGDDRPVIMMGKLRNKTSEHFNMKAITDKIRVSLQQSMRVRFTANDLRTEVLKEQEYQESGLVNPETAARTGNAVGAQYMLAGEIMDIVTKVKRTRDVYYKVTLNLIDVRTQVIEWSEEKEIRKQAVRRGIGR